MANAIVQNTLFDNIIAEENAKLNERLETVHLADGSTSVEQFSIVKADGEKTALKSAEAIEYTKMLHLINAVSDKLDYSTAYGFYRLRKLEIWKQYGAKSFKEYVSLEFDSRDPKTAQAYANVGEYFLEPVYEIDGQGNPTDNIVSIKPVSILPKLPINHYNQLLGMMRSDDFGLSFLEEKTVSGELFEGMSQKDVKDFVSKYKVVPESDKDGKKDGGKDGKKDGEKGAKEFNPKTATPDEIITVLSTLAINFRETVEALDVRADLDTSAETDKVISGLYRACGKYLENAEKVIITLVGETVTGENETETE